MGSKHTIQFLLSVDEFSGSTLGYQAANGDVTRWAFGGWVDNLGLLATKGELTETISVQPGLTSITGTVTTTYLVAIQFYNSTTSTQTNVLRARRETLRRTAFAPESSTLAELCYADSTTVYLPPGLITLNAFPYPGFVIRGVVDRWRAS